MSSAPDRQDGSAPVFRSFSLWDIFVRLCQRPWLLAASIVLGLTVALAICFSVENFQTQSQISTVSLPSVKVGEPQLANTDVNDTLVSIFSQKKYAAVFSSKLIESLTTVYKVDVGQLVKELDEAGIETALPPTQLEARIEAYALDFLPAYLTRSAPLKPQFGLALEMSRSSRYVLQTRGRHVELTTALLESSVRAFAETLKQANADFMTAFDENIASQREAAQAAFAKELVFFKDFLENFQRERFENRELLYSIEKRVTELEAPLRGKSKVFYGESPLHDVLENVESKVSSDQVLSMVLLHRIVNLTKEPLNQDLVKSLRDELSRYETTRAVQEAKYGPILRTFKAANDRFSSDMVATADSARKGPFLLPLVDESSNISEWKIETRPVDIRWSRWLYIFVGIFWGLVGGIVGSIGIDLARDLKVRSRKKPIVS